LENYEKNFIAEWIQKHRTSSGVIHWKYIVNDLKLQFGKRHSENKIKNFWNARKKSYLRKSRNELKQQRLGVKESEERVQEQGKAMNNMKVEENERKFIFHFVTSDDFFLPTKDQDGCSKITISSLLNFDNL